MSFTIREPNGSAQGDEHTTARMTMVSTARNRTTLLLIGIGIATASAHIGNNFTTYLIGGLIDRFDFTPVQMGAWSMTETLAYAASMFLIAPRVATLSPRYLLMAAGLLVTGAQFWSAGLRDFSPLLAGRVATGVGFGLANTALNLAAGRTDSPARALSIGIAVQTFLYALINLGLPMVGARFGVAGMFCALAMLSALFVLPAVWLPAAPGEKPVTVGANQARAQRARTERVAVGGDRGRVLIAMALFTFGSLAIWPFMERAAHAIGLTAITYGRYQSIATLACMLGNLGLAAVNARLTRTLPLVCALSICGLACAGLTTVTSGWAFALMLVIFNASWFVSYPLLMGIGYSVDHGGRLAVLCSAVWLLMMSLGSLATGITAQLLRGYRPVGPMGFIFCLAAVVAIWPLARRLDAGARPRNNPDPAITSPMV